MKLQRLNSSQCPVFMSSKRHQIGKETFRNECVQCTLAVSVALCKLTRNKNARQIFPHHFFPVAIIGIICLHMHSVLYTLNTQSIFFKYLHYFRLYDHHCTKCTCTSCAPTTRFFLNQKLILTLLRSFTEQTTCVEKD